MPANIFYMFVLTGIFYISTTAYAHAYVDPGSGSVIVTAILGFFAAIGYTMRKQFYKIRRIFKRGDKGE